ncbi:DNA repair protein RAD16 [Grifola frondosa]|uniref:DNA repair protein RAD16 n=1 Tax=Grifola frondosa TaxID=5627 RepID=A0A1C7M519_GRIFR|nr:DNA repair protein RAD16 [Grifola frondosa]
MPVTRQGARRQASSASTTPSAAVSPRFGTRASARSTPNTSDVEEEAHKSVAVVKSRRTTRSTTKNNKRTLESDSEIEGQATSTSKKAAKRRLISQSAYVEIHVDKKTANATATTASKTRLTTRATRLRVALPPQNEQDSEDNIDESDDSESEFELSDDESPLEEIQEDDQEENGFGDDLAQEGFDDDEVMMDAAIKMSLDAARLQSDRKTGASSGGAGSSKSHVPISRAAALRAAAAERRLAASQKEIIDVDAFSSSDEFQVEALESDDDSEPLSKGKGKGKAVNTSKPMEEADMRKKLGRKLTHSEKTTVALHKHHPELRDVWGDLERDIAVVVPKKAPQPVNLKATLLPFQQESLFWMKKQEQGPWSGGMLADEMGMGKTIQMLALMVSDAGAKPNLVVAPTVAIMQWRNEIQAHTDCLKAHVWHGSSRESKIKEIMKYDVILTSYAVLESCFRKQHSGFKRKGQIVKEKSPLHAIKWNRVILDEAHNIKERATNTAKAAFELQAKYRWCLSGTPLQNRVGELYSLVRFLGGDPFSYYFCKQCDCRSLHWKFSDKRSCDDCGHSPMKHTCFWNNEILTPIQKNGMLGPGKIAFKKLKVLLDRMMLRRTKIQKADDLGLPPRTVVIRRDYFSPEEKELYLSLFSDAKRQFNTYVDSGTVLNNYSNIFSLLTRMRQMACHPDLVLRSKNNAGTFIQDTDGEATVCRLCNDVAEDAIQAKCRHIFDRECIKQYLNTAIEATPACPVCHVALTIDLEAPALELEENAKPRQGILGRLDLDKWRSSSKIEALVEELCNLRKQDATTKSLVFSQFVNFLDLIAFRLQKVGFNVCRLEGTMSPQARDATIQHFMNNVHVTVFLVSLKAGGVALNLTEASRVYLMDSWWNPAVEYQAMDRIHRLGQHRPVQAIKLVVEDSIESRIIQLQEKKSAMVDATLSSDDSAMGRLTPEDLGFLFRL